jgi:hypothetical protein
MLQASSSPKGGDCQMSQLLVDTATFDPQVRQLTLASRA